MRIQDYKLKNFISFIKDELSRFGKVVAVFSFYFDEDVYIVKDDNGEEIEDSDYQYFEVSADIDGNLRSFEMYWSVCDDEFDYVKESESEE